MYIFDVRCCCSIWYNIYDILVGSNLKITEVADIIDNPKTGLIHLTNNTPISKYNLLHLFKEIYEKDVQIVDEKDYICVFSCYNGVA